MVESLFQIIEGLGIFELLEIDVSHAGIGGAHTGVGIGRCGSAVNVQKLLIIFQRLFVVSPCCSRCLRLGQQVLGYRGLAGSASL